jgi:hypothetical protein
VTSLDEMIATDPWAIASVRQAVRILLSGDPYGAEDGYRVCRLAAEPLVLRWPTIPHTVPELAVILLKLAADAALALLPAGQEA